MGVADHADRLWRWPMFMITASAIVASVTLVSGRSRRRILAILAIGLGPVIMAYIYSQYRQSIFLERVFVPSAVFISIALAAAASTVGAWRRGALLLCGVVIALSVTSSVLALRYAHEDPWREAMLEVQATARPQDRVLFFAAEGELMYWYYRDQLKWAPASTGGIPRDFLAEYPPRVQVPVKSEADIQPLRQALARGKVTRVILVDAHAKDMEGYARLQQLFAGEWKARQLFDKEPIKVWVYER